jgi:hypothetical protein
VSDATSEGGTGGGTRKDVRSGVALLGGYRGEGRLRFGERFTRVSLIGGIDLDLTDAELTGDRLTIVKVSLMGGIELRVPADARVEIHGLSIGGRHDEGGAPTPGGPTIVLYGFGILGGVKIRRGPRSS